MWLKWLPWRFIVSNAARQKGFLDPIALMSRLQRFSQPSEIAAPTELLRSGAVLHARGLMNSQAIQHNMDWIWPFWVERQFNPLDDAFVPRAFSITHINLTHRNWTAVGLPDTEQWPIIDPRGLVTPFYDSWSLDFWIVADDGRALFPSRLGAVSQEISTQGNLVVTTQMHRGAISLTSAVEVVGKNDLPICKITLSGFCDTPARLIVAVRPYNPEGVSFLHDVAWREERTAWLVNDKHWVHFSDVPQQHAFSDYHNGDVYSHLPLVKDQDPGGRDEARPKEVRCEVGMATAGAIYRLEPKKPRQLTVHIPLVKYSPTEKWYLSADYAGRQWHDDEQGTCRLSIHDTLIQFLYDTALRTLILHSPGDVYPGPFTYKRFWFRDAAFILYAMLCAGFTLRVERALNRYPSRQKQFGYFLSQEGEWDSNGEALWILKQFCELTGRTPALKWKESILRGGDWLCRKRTPLTPASPHAGLLPAGFSAEHLGPNDFYYWDDFWGVAGLRAAGFLAEAYGEEERAGRFYQEADIFLKSIERSLLWADRHLRSPALPASPYRRLDAGAIGSIVADYPLQLYPAQHKRIMGTVEFLLENCAVKGGFFQDMTHSGINPYLTLHIAQVLLRAEDPRFEDMLKTVAGLASSTGQWPEAVHPRTGGGCMGDGQHVWAAAEWVMMIRNCFVRSEEDGRLVLCSGILPHWFPDGGDITFGPAPTPFGPVSLCARRQNGQVEVEWSGEWFHDEPGIDVRLPGYPKVTAAKGQARLLTSV